MNYITVTARASGGDERDIKKRNFVRTERNILTAIFLYTALITSKRLGKFYYVPFEAGNYFKRWNDVSKTIAEFANRIIYKHPLAEGLTRVHFENKSGLRASFVRVSHLFSDY